MDNATQTGIKRMTSRKYRIQDLGEFGTRSEYEDFLSHDVLGPNEEFIMDETEFGVRVSIRCKASRRAYFAGLIDGYKMGTQF